MISDVTIGQYLPGNSFIHKIDARIKIVISLLFIISVFLCRNYISLSFVLLLALGVCALSRIKPKIILKGLKPIIIIVLFTTVINLFYGNGEPIFQFWILKITVDGINKAVFMGLRIIILVIFGRYIFQSALSNWKINAELLSHLAIKLIIDKYGYREEKHGAFDLNVGSGRGRSTVPNERIGKKYQWLALHDLLARVADNFPKLEHIWSEHVVKFEGPWDPFVRDIDPTTLVRREGNQQRTKPVLLVITSIVA